VRKKEIERKRGGERDRGLDVRWGEEG